MPKSSGISSIFSGSLLTPFSGTWAECNGQMVSKEQYSELFSLIGTTYGGDGNPNFALPTLTPPLKGLRYLICVRGLYPQKYQTLSIDSQASLLSPDNGPAPGLPFIGAIRGFSGSSYVPLSGTASCNGQMVSKEQYRELFS
ncbi:MAG: tail fiber protein [Bacteroidia bacterium]